jgi:hypothetical protein
MPNSSTYLANFWEIGHFSTVQPTVYSNRSVRTTTKHMMGIRPTRNYRVILRIACCLLLIPICDSFQATYPFSSMPLASSSSLFIRSRELVHSSMHAWAGTSLTQQTRAFSHLARQGSMRSVFMQTQGSQSKPPILLIGGTGRVGGLVAQSLVARGEKVRALVRDTNSPRCLALKETCKGSPGDLEVVEGDVAKFATVLDAMQGCAACVACYGSVRETNILKDSAYKIWDPTNQFLGTFRLGCLHTCAAKSFRQSHQTKHACGSSMSGTKRHIEQHYLSPS